MQIPMPSGARFARERDSIDWPFADLTGWRATVAFVHRIEDLLVIVARWNGERARILSVIPCQLY
jgi:hypothetical protein